MDFTVLGLVPLISTLFKGQLYFPLRCIVIIAKGGKMLMESFININNTEGHRTSENIPLILTYCKQMKGNKLLTLEFQRQL